MIRTEHRCRCVASFLLAAIPIMGWAGAARAQQEKRPTNVSIDAASAIEKSAFKKMLGLRPAWYLLASRDFEGSGHNGPIGRWTGTGLASRAQGTRSARPVFRGKAVHFDGVNDKLVFTIPPLAASRWSYCIIFRLHSKSNYDGVCGGAFDFHRGLEVQLFGDSFFVRMSDNTDWTPGISLPVSSQYYVLVLRRTDSGAVCHVDGQIASTTKAPSYDASGGTFHIGNMGWKPSDHFANISVAYVAFFPRDIGERGVAILRELRNVIALPPPVQLILGDGQSNYQYSASDVWAAWAASYDNPKKVFRGGYGGTPLDHWVYGDGKSEVFARTPTDINAAAPTGSKAFGRKLGYPPTKEAFLRGRNLYAAQGIADVLFYWNQGEDDSNESNRWSKWEVNDRQEWNRYPDTYERCDTYAKRLAAFSGFLRDDLGWPDLWMCVALVNIPYWENLPGLGPEAHQRLRRKILDAVAADDHMFYVDGYDIPRGSDNLHYSKSDVEPGKSQSPNSGAEITGRSIVRLNDRKAKFSTLSADARMICIRLIDAGFAMSDADMDAVEAFVKTAGFDKLRTLSFPAFDATSADNGNTFDLDRLQRVNAVLHLGDKDDLAYLTAAAATCTAEYEAGGGLDEATLRTAIETLLTAWGVSDTVAVQPEKKR